MTKRYHKFEASAWFLTKVVLYLSLLATFIYILGFDNPGLTQVSRTLGIVCVTCAVLEFMFVKTYGGYDVGRRKSKPILFSIFLATVLTDIIAYLQVMVMRVNLITVKHFALRRLDLLLYVIIVQFIIIAVFTYAGNGIFFKVHEPENCIIITDTQTHLNEVVKAVSKYKKQYAITGAVHYKNPNLKELIKESDALFISEVPAGERAAILHYAYKCQKNVYMTPEIEDIMEMNSTDYQIDDAVMINYLGRTFTFEQRIVKRVFDIVISVITLILTSPVLLVAIILIKAEDGGSIIYKQARATINGRIFNVYKLRTMKENDNSHSATINDDRITKIGKFLRRTRIDEIPQVYNVLKGDMSFVGPRPEMVKNVEKYTEELPEFAYRLRVKAGLTGYAQIAGKYNTTPRDKLIMDMIYIEKFSILLDIQLILKTVVAVFSPESSEGFIKESGNELGLMLDMTGVKEEG